MRIPNMAYVLGILILGCPHTLSSDLWARSTELPLFGSVNEALSQGLGCKWSSGSLVLLRLCMLVHVPLHVSSIPIAWLFGQDVT